MCLAQAFHRVLAGRGARKGCAAASPRARKACAPTGSVRGHKKCRMASPSMERSAAAMDVDESGDNESSGSSDAKYSKIRIAARPIVDVPLVNKVLDLGRDGSWKFSKELERYLGMSRGAASKATKQQVDGDILATLVVIAYLKARFATESNMWTAMVTKAKTYVGKTIPEEKQNRLMRSLENMF